MSRNEICYAYGHQAIFEILNMQQIIISFAVCRADAYLCNFSVHCSQGNIIQYIYIYIY